MVIGAWRRREGGAPRGLHIEKSELSPTVVVHSYHKGPLSPPPPPPILNPALMCVGCGCLPSSLSLPNTKFVAAASLLPPSFFLPSLGRGPPDPDHISRLRVVAAPGPGPSKCARVLSKVGERRVLCVIRLHVCTHMNHLLVVTVHLFCYVPCAGFLMPTVLDVPILEREKIAAAPCW